MHTVAILYPGHSAEDEFPALEELIPNTSFPVIHTWEGSTDHDVEALLAGDAIQAALANLPTPKREKSAAGDPGSIIETDTWQLILRRVRSAPVVAMR